MQLLSGKLINLRIFLVEECRRDILFKKNKNSLSMDSMQNGVKVITVANPSSVISEQFKTIRTNIQFSNADYKYKKLMITSSTVSEGKSTVSANIAVTFANQGLRTILVDADLRRPTISATFGIVSSEGVTNFLTNHEFSPKKITYKTSVNNLFVMPSGPVPPNPAELINSNRMDELISYLSENFDLVIYDAPPVLSVTDAQILSTKVEGTILVVRENHVEKGAVRQALSLLSNVNAKVIGTIINDVEINEDEGYYGYYGVKDKRK